MASHKKRARSIWYPNETISEADYADYKALLTNTLYIYIYEIDR